MPSCALKSLSQPLTLEAVRVPRLRGRLMYDAHSYGYGIAHMVLKQSAKVYFWVVEEEKKTLYRVRGRAYLSLEGLYSAKMVQKTAVWFSSSFL